MHPRSARRRSIEENTTQSYVVEPNRGTHHGLPGGGHEPTTHKQTNPNRPFSAKSESFAQYQFCALHVERQQQACGVGAVSGGTRRTEYYSRAFCSVGNSGCLSSCRWGAGLDRRWPGYTTPNQPICSVGQGGCWNQGLVRSKVSLWGRHMSMGSRGHLCD